MPLLHISISDALIIFFLTLGPLKAIAPFAQLTQGTDPAFRRTLAWRATAIATSIVIIVALLGSLVLKNWHVSVAAIVITGGIILFCQAFRLIMQPSAIAPASTTNPWTDSANHGYGPIFAGHSCPGHCSRHCRHCRIHGYCRG